MQVNIKISINAVFICLRLSLPHSMDTYAKLQEATGYLKTYTGKNPGTAVVLGSGLGNFVQEIQVDNEIEYDRIPHFPVATVEGHHGKLIFGSISGKPIIAMAGRFHFYEGYSPEEVVFPIRVLKNLGIRTLLISN